MFAMIYQVIVFVIFGDEEAFSLAKFPRYLINLTIKSCSR